MISSLLVAALVVLGLYVASHRLTGLQTLAALLFLAGGVVLVISPALAETIAEWLHVGRGTDLVTYFAIVGGLFVTANFYFRFKRQEQALITTVRSIALLKPLSRGDEDAQPR